MNDQNNDDWEKRLQQDRSLAALFPDDEVAQRGSFLGMGQAPSQVRTFSNHY